MMDHISLRDLTTARLEAFARTDHSVAVLCDAMCATAATLVNTLVCSHDVDPYDALELAMMALAQAEPAAGRRAMALDRSRIKPGETDA